MVIKPKKPPAVPKPPGGTGAMPKSPVPGRPSAPPSSGPVFKPPTGGGIEKPTKPPKRPGRRP